MKKIQQVLIDRDGLTPEEAEAKVQEAREDLDKRISEASDDFELYWDLCEAIPSFMEEHFGLENDYLDQLMKGGK